MRRMGLRVVLVVWGCMGVVRGEKGVMEGWEKFGVVLARNCCEVY